MPVNEGDTVKLEYTGTFEDGTVFDSSEKHGRPLEFKVGTGQVIKGFENAVKGMEIGEEKKIKLQPSEAYGEFSNDLIKEVPKNKIPAGHELEKDMMLLVKRDDGSQVISRIKDISENTVTVDMNHPLAGKIINFDIKVVDIT